MEFNKYQSSIEDLNIDSYPLEIKEAFYDFMTNVPYIKSLVSPNRPYAKDCPRDSEGKIIVDLTSPPIIEDTDYFRPTAIHYLKYGCLTKLRPNPNPNSEYGKWIREETRRIYFGYIRKSDGAWVTGDMYFFLNYCPIVKVKRIQGKQGIRTVDFPDFLEGQWLKFMYIELARKNAKHGSELASRGKGKSYCMAAILARRFILGEYDIIKKEPTKKVESFVASYLKNYLNEDGVLNKFESYIDFCAEASEFPRKRLISSINNMHWQMGYKENESVAKKGSLNEVIGISVKDSAGKLRGKRGAFIGLEEFGSFPNLIELYGTLRPSMEDGDIVFGMIYCLGTSGDKESDFSAALKIMYSPKAFNMLSIPNVYDKVGQGKRDFVYFYPAYVNRNGCYNKDGISDVTKAILEVLINRYNVKYNTTDANLITKTIAEHPIVPLEAIMRTRGNMFPVLSINERLNQLDNNPNEYDDVYIGNLLLLKDGTVKFSPDSDDIPIREYPLKDNKNKGAIEIYELPQKDSNGHIFAERYIIGHDPVDDDVSNTSSLTSTFVLDLLTDRIVAEYTGRQEYADSNFEIVRRLCIFYNAKCMYECHPYSLEVIKADGTRTTWQNIHIGDTLNSIGGKTTVVDIPFNLKAKIYKVTLKDGRTIMAGEDHAWDVIKVNCPDKWFTITTKQMLNYGVKDKYNRHIFYIPNAGRVDYPYLEVPIDPYTLGLLLAEGAFTKFRRNKYETFNRKLIQFSSSKEDASFYLTVIPYLMKYIGTKGYSWHLYIDNIDDILKSLGLLFCKSEDKFIPNMYLCNDYNTRLELLKGLMDGDGCASVNGAPVLVTSSKKLKDTVMILCRSLGLNCSYKKKNTTHLPSYRISIYTDIPIFKLPRKVQILHIYRPNMTGSKANSFINKVAILSIEYSHIEMAKCITVDRHDGLYLIGDYVLTHNCNKKGIFSYFSKLNSLQWLAETPTYLKDLLIIKEIGYGNKAHPYDLKVYTPNGIKTWKDIKIGDYLYGINNNVTKVIDIPFDDITSIYKITLKDGRTVEASENHLWNIIDWNGISKVLSTKQILSGYYREKGKYREYKYYIKSNLGVEFKEQNIPLPSYFIGLMLGDGCFRNSRHHNACFASSLKDMEVYKTLIPYEIKTVDDRHHWIRVPNIGSILQNLALLDTDSHTKFIPDVYKYNSRLNRLELLRGLLDTDGTIGYGGNAEYTTVSRHLANDIVEVARSLGINCNTLTHYNKYGIIYKVIFYTSVRLFNLPRKYNKQRLTKCRAFKTAIVNIEYIGEKMAKCVTVDSQDSSYLIGDFVATHNSRGVNATAAINAFADRLTREWLIKPVTVTKSIADSDELEVTLPNIMFVRSRAFLQELAAYNPQGNFDRIRAFGMLMIYRQEKIIMYQGDMTKTVNEDRYKDLAENDEFFRENYDDRFDDFEE